MRTRAVRAALFAAAAMLLAAGLAAGDCRLMFRKAVFVCMECMGIG